MMMMTVVKSRVEHIYDKLHENYTCTILITVGENKTRTEYIKKKTGDNNNKTNNNPNKNNNNDTIGSLARSAYYYFVIHDKRIKT